MPDDFAILTNPFLNLECRLNTKGRPRYGTLSQFLAANQGEPSTVGTPDGNIHNATIRNSTHYKAKLNFNMFEPMLESFIAEIADPEKRRFVRWLPDNHTYDVIVYEEGGFFKEHQDVKINRHHYGTLLVFPPAVGEFAHTGGDLIITRENGQQIVLESSILTEWKFVAFHPHLKHECLPVTSGRRVVMKTELCYTPHRDDSEYEYDEPAVCDRVRPSMMVMDRSVRE